MLKRTNCNTYLTRVQDFIKTEELDECNLGKSLYANGMDEESSCVDKAWSS